jgi:hypothetical protein
MPFPDDSNDHATMADEPGLPAMAMPSWLFRLLLWIVRTLGAEVTSALPVRVYYKFDSGCWRTRNTLQLHKEYRCR